MSCSNLVASCTRALCSIGIVMLLLVAGGGGTSHAQQEISLEDGFVRLQIKGILARDFDCAFSADTLFLPYRQTMDLLRILNQVSPDLQILSGEVPAGHPFLIDIVQGTALCDSATYAIDRSMFRIHNGEPYITDSLLSLILQTPVRFRTTDLSLSINPSDRIPLVALRKNSRRYSQLQGESEGADESSVDVGRTLLGSATIDWNLGAQYGNDGRGIASGGVNISGPFLYGLLDVAGRGGYTGFGRPPVGVQPKVEWNMSGLRWRFLVPGSALLSQFALSATPLPTGWGFVMDISNVPLAPRQNYGSRELVGQSEPGWTVEMYDRSKLVAVTTADSLGVYRFTIPIGYGRTTRTLMFIGPHGERVIEEKSILLDKQNLPAGEVEYGLNADTRTGDTLLPLNGALNLRAGITDRLSLSAVLGVTQSTFSDVGLGDLNWSLGGAFLVGNGLSTSFSYMPQNRTISAGMYSHFGTTGEGSISLESYSLRTGEFNIGAEASIQPGFYYLSWHSRFTRTTRVTTVSVDPGISTILGPFSIDMRAQYLRNIVDDETELPGQSLIGNIKTSFRFVGSSRVALQFGYDCFNRTPVHFTVATGFRPWNLFGVGCSYSIDDFKDLHLRDWKRGRVNASLSFSLGSSQLAVTAFNNEDEWSIGAITSLAGTAQISSAGFSFSRYTQGDRSALILNAFHDVNGNGVRDGDEEEFDDIPATVDGTIHVKAVHNTFKDLPPNRRFELNVDKGALVHRGLYPRLAQAGIFTIPGNVQVIDLPFCEGYDIDGRCEIEFRNGVRKSGASVLTAIRITLTSSDEKYSYEGELFPDGSILVSGVAVGTYRISFDDTQLRSRGLSVKSMSEMVTFSTTSTTIPTIVFEPRADGPN